MYWKNVKKQKQKQKNKRFHRGKYSFWERGYEMQIKQK